MSKKEVGREEAESKGKRKEKRNKKGSLEEHH